MDSHPAQSDRENSHKPSNDKGDTMTRTLKLIGLAGMAMLAMTALAAASAQAVEFHAASAPVTVTGNQEEAHKFTANAGTISCNTATFHGEQEVTTAETLTITP